MAEIPPIDRDAEMSTLCRSCGFCCDGTLNYWAKLDSDKVAAARRCGLDVRESPADVGFRVPCPQLQNHLCAVYDDPDRPDICRAYRCWLSQRFMEGSVTAQEVAETIQLVDALKRAAATRIGPDRAAGWARGATLSFRLTRTGDDDELPEGERSQFAKQVATVPGATDENGTVNAQLLQNLLAVGRVLHREFVWPKEARERMLRLDREAAERGKRSPESVPGNE